MSEASLRHERAAQAYLQRATQLRSRAKALPGEGDCFLVFAAAYERLAASFTQPGIVDGAVEETVEI